MIPKTIHYCWFGGNNLPESAIKCINSWKKFFPDYEIVQWNESNFDVYSIPYTKDAYNAKKYAFVSDYARFWILYNFGGVYFDTDVEVVKSFEDIISSGPFMGVEISVGKETKLPVINPGLGIGAEKGMLLYEEMISIYQKLNFYDCNGGIQKNTMIPIISQILAREGLICSEDIQSVYSNKIYPVDFFNPYNSLTGQLKVTSNTHSIHWYTASWLSKQPLWLKKSKQLFHRILSK